MSRIAFLRRANFAPLALLAIALAACGGPRERPNVVLISIDTLRADRLPVYGYGAGSTPAIDALARDSVRFDAAYANYPLTLPSHVSLFTGLLPPRHGVRDNLGYRLDGAAHPTVAARLRAAGYSTGGFVSAYVLRGDTGVGSGFDVWDAPGLGSRREFLDLAQRPGSKTLEAARAWLAGRGAGPFFLFLHLYEPHAPYDPPEPFRSRFADPYDGEVATADEVVGRLLDDLRARGLYQDAIVALVSDHGEGLGDHGESKHGIFLYRATLRVPVLVKLPAARRAGEVIASPVELVDLPNTLLVAAGLDRDETLDGLDALGRLPADRGTYAETFYPRLHFGWSDLHAWTESRWSLVDGPAAELFDLAADPGQRENLLATERREAARLRGEISRRDVPLAAPDSSDAEAARKLAALGYLTGTVDAGDRLPDPRTQRDLLADLESGTDAYFAGDDERALELLGRVVERNPGMRDVWGILARVLDRMGRPREALRAWDRLLELSGGAPDAALLVGERHLAVGDVARARALAEIAASAEPEKADELFAEVALAEGRDAEADALLERVLAAGVASEPTRRRLGLKALAAGDPARALEILSPLEADGGPDSWILLALARAETGAGEAGVELLARARAAAPSEAEFFENLGVAMLRMGRLDRAAAALEECVRREPRAASAWNALGVARAGLGRADGAIDAWRHAVDSDPSLLDAWFNLGLTAASQGDQALARQALRTFLAQTPEEERFAADRERARRALASL